MSDSEAIAALVAKRWLARALESYPTATRLPLLSEADPFRDPVGHAIKENLRILAQEVFGEMDQHTVERALDMLIRLRVVQAFRDYVALQFIADFKPVLVEALGMLPRELELRCDDLVRMAERKYAECREQIESLRAKERRFCTQCEVQEQVLQ